MKVLKRDKNEVSIPTPDEVREKRMIRSSRVIFNEYRPLSPEIDAKITQIIAYRSPHYLDEALQLCYFIGVELHGRYDFYTGHRFIIGQSNIPENILRNEIEVKKYLNLTLEIMESFGWSLALTEDDRFYYFDFNALEKITPDQVELETKRRITTLAKRAQSIIYAGLLDKQHRFTLAELELDQVKSTLFPVVFYELINQLGPTWRVDFVDGSSSTFQITAITPM